jgi:hypothetical protein
MRCSVGHRVIASNFYLRPRSDGGTMKTLFWFGLAVVVLGLLSFVMPITHTERQTFQTGGIGIGMSQTEQRPLPAAVGAILVVGGLSMMVGGCRNKI